MSLRKGSQKRDDDQYIAAYLKVAEERFEARDKAVVLKAMHQCALLKKPLPEWLREAFDEALSARKKIRSWDEVFGLPNEKGAHLGPRQRYSESRYPVALRVALRAADQAIDKGLFEEIGSELGIGTTTVETIYEQGGKELAEMIEPLVPWLKSNPKKK